MVRWDDQIYNSSTHSNMIVLKCYDFIYFTFSGFDVVKGKLFGRQNLGVSIKSRLKHLTPDLDDANEGVSQLWVPSNNKICFRISLKLKHWLYSTASIGVTLNRVLARSCYDCVVVDPSIEAHLIVATICVLCKRHKIFSGAFASG